MKLREDQVRLQGLLKETITLLCKNGLQFDKGFCVEALIGITTDNSDVFLVNIKENVRNEGAEDTDPEFDVSLNKESQSDDESGKTKISRKRPPDQRTSDASPVKRNRSNADEQNYSDDDASNMSSNPDNEMAANVKREPDDDGDLVFVKQELTSDFDHTEAQVSHSQSFDMSQLAGQQSGFTPQDPGFDSSHDGSGSGSAWAQQRNMSLDASSMAMASQATSQGGSQQLMAGLTREGFIYCQICQKRFVNEVDLYNHYESAHQLKRNVGKYICEICDKRYTDRFNLKAHMFGTHAQGDAPRKCKICKEGFAWPASLALHMKKHHSMDK